MREVQGSSCTIDSKDEHSAERMTHRPFHHLFWSFRSCIKGFMHYKLLVQVNETHLYRKYKGTLMVAISQDGNNNVLPIAFPIVKGEIADVWSFLLSYL